MDRERKKESDKKGEQKKRWKLEKKRRERYRHIKDNVFSQGERESVNGRKIEEIKKITEVVWALFALEQEHSQCLAGLSRGSSLPCSQRTRLAVVGRRSEESQRVLGWSGVGGARSGLRQGWRVVQEGGEEGWSDREQGDGEARGGRRNAAGFSLPFSLLYLFPPSDIHTRRPARTL